MAGTAMKIRWVLRHNPQNRLLPPKYYAAPVFAGRRDAGEMIRQIAGRSVLSAGDIVDAQLMKAIKSQLNISLPE